MINNPLENVYLSQTPATLSACPPVRFLTGNEIVIYGDVAFGGGGDYWLIIEAWNRYASYYDGESFHYNSEILNYSFADRISLENHLLNPYYDKYYYEIMPAGGLAYSGTAYLCDNHLDNRTYTKNKIFAANANNSGCTYTVESDNNIKFYGIEEVTMRKGFTAKAGSDFIAKLDCGYILRMMHVLNNMKTKSIESLEIELFPNPTNGLVNVNIDGAQNAAEDVFYEILDSKGSLILSEQLVFVNKFQIDLSEIKPAQYVINIQVGDFVYSDVVIKQ